MINEHDYIEETPLVSIIIANYNYGRFLREAIDSALNQTYPYIEVIVVDDGSIDNSCEIIKSYTNQIIPILKENRGHSSVCNTGFTAGTGDIVCFLDADDWFTPNKVEQVIKLFEKNPLAGWVFHELDYVDVDGRPLDIEQDSLEFSEDTFLDLREAFSKSKFPYGPPPTPCLCFRRTLLKEILPIPESMGIAADGLLKFGAIKLSPGVHSPAKLTLQRIHGANALTKGKDETIKAKYGVKTAFYLRNKFSETARFTDKLFAGSFARLIATLGLKKTLQVYECHQYTTRYVSLTTWFVHGPRIAFICARTIWGRGGFQHTQPKAITPS